MMRFDEKALEGLPLPPNCPETGTCIRYEQPEPGLVVLVLDPPHRKLAVLDLPLMRDLSLAITRLEDDRALRGVVITGRAPLEFALGADIDAIGAIEDPALVERFIRLGQDLFHRLYRMENGAGRRVRTVAAVGSPAAPSSSPWPATGSCSRTTRRAASACPRPSSASCRPGAAASVCLGGSA
jgi:hypothetical protein